MPHFSLSCLCLFLVFDSCGLAVRGFDLVGEVMRHGGNVGLIWWVLVATRSWLFFLGGAGSFSS